MPSDISDLPAASAARPLRILFSGCLVGRACGYDATDYGGWPLAKALTQAPHVRVFPFCPEELSFGTPRELCNIHGGDGFDVLEGRATVLTESGVDWTRGLVNAAHRMLELAQKENVDLAVLMDISAACGSQVIYDGHRTIADKKYQRGAGVCAALLIKNGFRVISQRDHRTLELLRQKIDPGHTIDPAAVDHHQTEWYRKYFGT